VSGLFLFKGPLLYVLCVSQSAVKYRVNFVF